MMPLVFSTKAGTLALLQGKLRAAQIKPLVVFTVAEWEADPAGCISKVKPGIGDGPWIVRSSCQREDGVAVSNAGAFLSLPDVFSDGLEKSIEHVIDAYGQPAAADEVLIQPMLKNVLRSGVAFSHDPNTCAPYRVVNWQEGDDTSAVTGGAGGRTWQQAAQSAVPPAPTLSAVVALLEELLILFGDVPVDCEFAFTREDETEVLWLLQARPLVLANTPEVSRQN